MIDRALLLADLTDVVAELERDLRERTESVAEVGAKLRAEHQVARQRDRTAEAYEVWRDARITQVAVAWVLSCVFVRFLEDNGLIAQPYLSGPGDRLTLARDHHTLYFRANPRAEDPQYLQDVFRDVSKSPAMKALLGDQHNPLWTLTPSADGAKRLVEFWQKQDPTTGVLVHDFTDPEWNTRFLGDLYQDLSEAAQKRYALKQTPDFVLAFILDRTLEPAIHEFGFRHVRVIDPACGSGHFLLEAFRRLFERHQQAEPVTNTRALAQRTLDQVFGVDLNPYAIAIARFRLIVEALRVAGVKVLDQAPDFKANLAVGDSLLHGPRPRRIEGRQLLAWTEEDKLAHVYDTEDADELRRILGTAYHVVVGNPPYIQSKDPTLNAAYRARYESCHRKYSLGVPFTERFLDLALACEDERPSSAGYVGMITANSFMKREFGSVLIEVVLPRFDLTHVIDTSGAAIPGHNAHGEGTTTCILLVRNRRPVVPTVRAVRGIRGEPTTPDDPAHGLVWTSIVGQVDRPGSISAFVSADDVERTTFQRHPWSIGGGGAAELKQRIGESSMSRLNAHVDSIGFGCILGEDDAFGAPETSPRARAMPPGLSRMAVDGVQVRDWMISPDTRVLFPYSAQVELCPERDVGRFLWPLRTVLWARPDFSGRTYRECGRTYWEYHQIPVERNRTPLSITLGEIATHNHFALDRGGRVFNRTAPVIKLATDATVDDHLGLLGLLNSSIACFWLKQVCYPKGGFSDGKWQERIAINAANVSDVPVPHCAPTTRARLLDSLAIRLASTTPHHIVAGPRVPDAARVREAREAHAKWRHLMIAIQEDLDWECYHLYGLLEATLALPTVRVPGIRFGERAFEIAMARRMAAGEFATRWFESHGSAPITEVPSHWPEEYREIVRRRIEEIETNPDIALIEQPEYKRRWHTESWEEQEQRALREWLLDRLEDSRHWPDPQITTCARLADRLGLDVEFRQVAELYRGRADFNLTELVVELVDDEAVPFLAAFRYSESGAAKRCVWERTWDNQRREDAGEKVEIDVPPKYASGDFAKTTYWRLRGKLDVPKERFIIYPLAGTDDDSTTVIGWAGWDHLQQAKALAETIVSRREQEAWGAERLAPLLAGIAELLPWIRQWHKDPDPATGGRAGEVFAQFLEEQARSLGLTPEDLPKWTPPAGAGRKPRGRKKKA